MNKMSSIKLNKKFFIVLSTIVFSLAAIFIGFSIANAVSSNNVAPTEDMAINNSGTGKVAATSPSVNEGTEEKSFSFEITTKDSNEFTLPDSANVSGTNYWLVDWGDGSAEEFHVIQKNFRNSVSHTYSASNVTNYTIKISPANDSGEFDPDATAWMTRFGCYSWGQRASSRDMITTSNSPLTWQMTRKSIDEAPYGEFNCMFYGCSNLNFASDSLFTFPQDITVVNQGFAGDMFGDCSKLTELPENFNLPQNITTVDDDFAFYDMFYNCKSLESLPVNLTSSSRSNDSWK